MVNESFGVEVIVSEGSAVVFVHGEIDLSSASAIRHALSAAQQGCPDVIVDLSGVTFMDSTGINALLRAHSEAPPGGSLRVVGAISAVRRVFDIAGVSQLFLLEPQLTWLQMTYHSSGWRQWITEETANGGVPIGEIIEVGSGGILGGDDVHYALENNGETRLYGSLDEAMRAAELPGPVTPQPSE